MTEQEWLESTDPQAMLRYVTGSLAGPHPQETYRPKLASERKLRLFVCACCRQVWRGSGKVFHACITTAESFADGQATESQLVYAHRGYWPLNIETLITSEPEDFDAAEVMRACLGYDGTKEHQAALLRDIFGNPYKRINGICGRLWLNSGEPMPHNDCRDCRPILCWNNGTIPKLAQAIYEDRRFEDLPILADALEEANCVSPEILSHCRSGEYHCRGCCVVDLILGKE